MLKKFLNFSGYFFIESLVSLTILTVVIGGYLSVHTVLFSKAKPYEERLAMKRVLYEEMKEYKHYGGSAVRKVLREKKEYFVTIIEQDGEIKAATVENGKDVFTIERQ
ncbi:hypothetical protein LI951_07630 [Enterococcus sp. BWT-B8]|uniref:hypothetical protein n=1 Tax=Enterococcus sp. BWT-B8 TaxID=2885157 RepID=UPI001E657205|nr:hypothetical protein [Enterococcus sp. BWT-B8]MCB5951932.1 hypothetical protein [Enterococcus sp. BWT-B8]